MALGLRFHIFLFCFLTSFLNLTSCNYTTKDHVPFFIFGDSYFDVGNNNYFNTVSQANYKPYGDTFFKYPTGRFSDGRLISDFMAEYAGLLFLPPYLQGNQQFTYGVNFASSGAGALIETHRDMLHIKDLQMQLSYFHDVEKQLRQKLGNAEAKILLTRAVYLISIGSNDYLFPLYPNSTLLQTYTKEEYIGMVIGNLTNVIKGIYDRGGRKFGFLNVGPLGCTPYTIVNVPNSNGSCVEEATILAKLHNEALSLTLNQLQRQLKGFKYAIHDFFTSFSDILNNPSKYGFKEVKTACCGIGEFKGILSCGGRAGASYELCDDPSDYLFFDGFHLSEKAYRKVSELFWNGSTNSTGPYNVKALIKA